MGYIITLGGRRGVGKTTLLQKIKQNYCFNVFEGYGRFDYGYRPKSKESYFARIKETLKELINIYDRAKKESTVSFMICPLEYVVFCIECYISINKLNWKYDDELSMLVREAKKRKIDYLIQLEADDAVLAQRRKLDKKKREENAESIAWERELSKYKTPLEKVIEIDTTHFTEEETFIQVQAFLESLALESLFKGTYNSRFVCKNIIRSDRFDRNDIDLAKMKEYNVESVIDLRTECAPETIRLLDCTKIEYNSIPLKTNWISPKDCTNVQLAINAIPSNLFYLVQQENYIYQIFNILLNAKGTTILFCAYGKDRTGVIVALLEMLLNKSENEILKNFAISEYMMKTYYDSLPQTVSPKYDRIAAVPHMKSFLHMFKNQYISIENYLAKLGFSSKEIERLKEKYNGEN